jgi:hypothetical protein
LTLPDLGRPARGRWLGAVVALAFVAIMAGCGGGDPAGAAPGTSAATATATVGVGTPASPTDAPSPTGATGSPGSPVPAASTGPSLTPIVVDPALLSILPASVDGIAVQAAPETATQMLADPELARSASAVAIGIVVAPGSSTGDDIASAGVIQLRPGIFDTDFYATWRAGYDAAACAQAGGIGSHLQQQIGSHAVEVTVCSGGARTYHTHLAGDVLVSITAVGDRRFGERVLAGLRR